MSANEESRSRNQQYEPADPEEVDKEPVMAIGACENCGPNTLATVRVEEATYISSCAQCDYQKEAPVKIGEDGRAKVVTAEATESGINA